MYSQFLGADCGADHRRGFPGSNLVRVSENSTFLSKGRVFLCEFPAFSFQHAILVSLNLANACEFLVLPLEFLSLTYEFVLLVSKSLVLTPEMVTFVAELAVNILQMTFLALKTPIGLLESTFFGPKSLVRAL
jgi:hypothetical protein